MKKREKQEKAITLVALIVTIIILLILAGISIQAITNTGLFEGANQAKKETKRAQVTEWLNLKLIEVQMNNPTGTAEEIIVSTRQNVVENKDELEKIGNPVTVEDTKTEEDGEQVAIYFYVQVDEDVYKVEMAGAKFIGEAGKFPPIIKLESITGTTNSITVTVTTKRNEGGTIKFSIKQEGDSDYGSEVTKTETEASCTFTGLEQNKKYNIKIVATSAENGQTSELLVDKTLGSVPDLATGDITFTYTVDGQVIDKNIWTNKNVTVTASTEITGYSLQTSKDGKTWYDVRNQTFTENGKIYVALYDGKNYGGSATGNVTNIDTTKPIVTGATATTNSIAITATDEASGIVGYAVTESSTEPSASSFTAVDSTTSFSTTVTGKTQGTTYYVWVKDAAGNISVSKSTKTGTVTSGTENGAITFGTTTWAEGKASTTISTNTSYTIQYQVNSTSESGWTTGTSVTNLLHGNIVYARLWDGTNGGTAATNNILDGIDPSASISLSAQNVYTTGSITATVTHTDNESGVKIANCKWVYNTTSSAIGTDASSYTGTFSSASQTITLSATTAGTYYLHVLTTDVAGRTVETISNAVTVKIDPLSIPTNPATTIAEAQSDYMLTKTVNSPIQDAYGNKITVPAGFKIKVDSSTNDATTVDKGIVIIDSNENEFVWIPVGTIYTNAEKTASETIELGRYSFASDGTPSAYSGSFVEEDSTDTANLKNYGNTIAKNINEFKTKTSAAQSGGFYIGRYEARTATARSAKTEDLTTLTTKASDYVYNYVTQIQAADLARNMYKDSTKFSSDLMNSYAWDTATLFLQTFGDNSTYSRKKSVNTTLATTGTNNQTTKDVQCNVYDMASNTREWTTETYSDSSYPCVGRGGQYDYSGNYTSNRQGYISSSSYSSIGFRPLLYVNV